MFDCIDDYEYEEHYIINPELRLKAKQEAITKLYNKYIKYLLLKLLLI